MRQKESSDEAAYRAIRERWGFDVPGAYRGMRSAGLIGAGKEALCLTDHEWLSPSDIASYEPREDQIPGIIPFAESARADMWCWREEWAAQPGGGPIAFCPFDVDEAEIYAPSFAGAIFRLLLEEFSGSWLVKSYGLEATEQRYRDYVGLVAPFLPEPWVATLSQVADAPLRRLGEADHGFVHRVEAEGIIARTFGHAVEGTFKHYV